MNLRFIVMHTGYVESCSTSSLIYQCEFFGNPGYSNYKDAITDLALDLYAKFYDEHLSTYENRYGKNVKDCCRQVLIANKTAKTAQAALHCSTCGHRLADKKFNYEDFQQYICDLHGTTCDSYGEAEGTSTRNMTWWPWWNEDFLGAPKKDIIYIAEMAELVLLAALLEAKPELKNSEDETDFSHCEWDKFKKDEQPSYR